MLFYASKFLVGKNYTYFYFGIQIKFHNINVCLPKNPAQWRGVYYLGGGVWPPLGPLEMSPPTGGLEGSPPPSKPATLLTDFGTEVAGFGSVSFLQPVPSTTARANTPKSMFLMYPKTPRWLSAGQGVTIAGISLQHLNIFKEVGYYVNSPAISEHFIPLAIRYCRRIVIWHRLQSFTFYRRKFTILIRIYVNIKPT